jgi:hypothetical protein
MEHLLLRSSSISEFVLVHRALMHLYGNSHGVVSREDTIV